MIFEIKDLHANVEGKEILKGVNLTLPPGQVHAIMGPNGSGKSTLASTIMGHPKYQITKGDILLDGKSVLDMPPHERARAGLFLSFQYPASLPGVTMPNFFRNMLKSLRQTDMPVKEFRKELKDSMAALKMNESFLARYVNEGFSGGEKKRNEILQMRLMQPKVAILDEIDSGLDIDALKTIAEGIELMRAPDRSMLVITHYTRILNYLTLDGVHVFMNGRIIKSGGRDLAKELEERGYDWAAKEAGVA
ncbi:MAG: Fe-S cluster assembly ATPase SufC [Spirochaetia bacterium]|nr:Fe-S cluster assembly ATPase SufC [Spirochaetia bacterium]